MSEVDLQKVQQIDLSIPNKCKSLWQYVVQTTFNAL